MDIFKRLEIGAKWMRDSFASWFSTAWLYLILWGVVAGAFTVLLYIDGKFSRSLAPDSVNPLSFQAMGWVYRFFAAAFLMAAARCVFKGIPVKITFDSLGAFASVIGCMHAFGFGFEALSDRRDQAMSVREVAAIAETSNADLIATLETRKTQIDADLEAAIAPLNAEIFNLDNDGLLNEERTDRMRDRRVQLQDQAIADKRAIDDQIMQLVMSGAETRTEAVQTVTNAQPWHPLFIGMAQVTTRSKEPTDWAIYLNAIGFIIFWVLLAESLVIFLPERIYLMHMHDAEAAKRSEAARKGHETRKAKEAEASQPLKIEDAEYWLTRIPKALNTGLKRRTIKGMCQTYFGQIEPGALREHLYRQIDKRIELPGTYQNNKGDTVPYSKAIERGLLSAERPTYLMQEHIDFIFSEGEYAPEPKQDLNGTKPNGADNADDTGTDRIFSS